MRGFSSVKCPRCGEWLYEESGGGPSKPCSCGRTIAELVIEVFQGGRDGK